MRSGVRLALTFGWALPLGACSGGYPLPPTRCDEWCDVTKGGQCERYYQPAGCVSNCEQSNTDSEACRAEFDAELRCFRQNPSAVDNLCDYYSNNVLRPCDLERNALSNCVGNQFIGSVK